MEGKLSLPLFLSSRLGASFASRQLRFRYPGCYFAIVNIVEKLTELQIRARI